MSRAAAARDGNALRWAVEAHALVPAHPHKALALAERARAAARAAHDVEAELSAFYSLAYAQLALGDRRAMLTMRTGIRLGLRRGNRQAVGLLRRLLAVSLSFAGDTRAARREIDAAIALLTGLERARSEVHRLAIYRGALAADRETDVQTLAAAARALRLLERRDDRLWEARLLYNRGLVFLDRGEADRAEADLRRALGLYDQAGAETRVIDTRVALAGIALARGDVVGSLGRLDEAAEQAGAEGLHFGLIGSRVAALTAARLLDEARDAGQTYIEVCRRTGRGDYVASTQLELATIAYMSVDYIATRRLALAAMRSFAARGKPVNAALARTVALRACVLADDVPRSSLRSGLKAAAVLENAGWHLAALRTRLVVARLALAVGASEVAARQLELARPLETRGTVADRVETAHVRALQRLADGDHRGAQRLLGSGLRRLEEHRAALGAADLRVAASSLGVQLSQLGLGLATEFGNPADILIWAERSRANALRLPSTRPASDPRLKALQTSLRQLLGQIDTCTRELRPHGSLLARQVELERAIRNRSRQLRGAGRARGGIPLRRHASAALGERALVEYIELGGTLGVLTLVRGRLTFHALAAQGWRDEAQWLRFGIARLARGSGHRELDTAVAANVAHAAAALDRFLVEPIADRLAQRAVVLVPTGPLHEIPWAALPSLRGRPLVVAPSLTKWLELEDRPSGRRRTVLVAGPRLRHSTAEIRDLALIWSDATVLAGKVATVDRVLASLDGAGLVHIACHGRFRADSPLFSALELADGPLNVYELESLRQAPELVVLSACDLAMPRLHPGDELLGFAAALLGMGTRSIVASVVPVPDAAARRMMREFHRHLLAGGGPAEALAHAQAKVEVAGFVCLGTG